MNHQIGKNVYVVHFDLVDNHNKSDPSFDPNFRHLSFTKEVRGITLLKLTVTDVLMVPHFNQVSGDDSPKYHGFKAVDEDGVEYLNQYPFYSSVPGANNIWVSNADGHTNTALYLSGGVHVFRNTQKPVSYYQIAVILREMRLTLRRSQVLAGELPRHLVMRTIRGGMKPEAIVKIRKDWHNRLMAAMESTYTESDITTIENAVGTAITNQPGLDKYLSNEGVYEPVSPDRDYTNIWMSKDDPTPRSLREVLTTPRIDVHPQDVINQALYFIREGMKSQGHTEEEQDTFIQTYQSQCSSS